VPWESLSAVFIVTMAVSVAVCELFSVKACDLRNWVRGRSRSLKMAPFDRRYATFYWSAIVTIALFCTIFEFFWRRIISRTKFGLEVTQCHWNWRHSKASIVTVAVAVAVCETFSVKEWRDLVNHVRNRSRSLKMAPFDWPYATFYWSAIVNITLSCTIFKLFDVE